MHSWWTGWQCSLSPGAEPSVSSMTPLSMSNRQSLRLLWTKNSGTTAYCSAAGEEHYDSWPSALAQFSTEMTQTSTRCGFPAHERQKDSVCHVLSVTARHVISAIPHSAHRNLLLRAPHPSDLLPTLTTPEESCG